MKVRKIIGVNNKYMNKEILYAVLQLDSIFGFLDWTERAYVHQYRLDKTDNLNIKIVKAYQFIERSNWRAPEMRYMDDRLVYFKSQDTGNWHLIESYKEIYPSVEKAIKHLKI